MFKESDRRAEPPVRVLIGLFRQPVGSRDELYKYIIGLGGHLPNKEACDLYFLRSIVKGNKHVSSISSILLQVLNKKHLVKAAKPTKYDALTVMILVNVARDH